jgi:hypothetical protein
LSAIISLETLLVAAAIAAAVTFGIEWVHATSLKTESNLKAEKNCCAFRTTTSNAGFLLDSPFAHGNALFFLPEPLGYDASHQGQAAPRETEQRPSAELIIVSQLPQRVTFDEHILSVPVPQPRPFIVQRATASLDATARGSETPWSAGSSAFLNLLKNLFGRSGIDSRLPGAVGHTAVYDIEARVVYLPNGEKLEAHSGLGRWLDDVRYVSEKGRGPTPPNVYRLALREELFHGVQAIRLHPVGGGNMYGRSGILAHPYMLGPNGQSNGCVSLQDYPKFLEAFLRGDIDRLVVVPSSAASLVRTADNDAGG